MNQSNPTTMTELIPSDTQVISRGASPELQATTLGLSIVIALVVMAVIRHIDK